MINKKNNWVRNLLAFMKIIQDTLNVKGHWGLALLSKITNIIGGWNDKYKIYKYCLNK